MAILALDIGGANLKASHSTRGERSVAFALWKSPERLAGELRKLSRELGGFDTLLVTMTAELCDCFATRRDGVFRVLDSVESVARARPAFVWSTRGRFMSTAGARREPMRVAAGNWHAQATWVARMFPEGSSVLIDTGSTTTDIIPLRDGCVFARGLTDTDRLRTGELVYLGAWRTPLMSLCETVMYRGEQHRTMAEYFASTADVGVLLSWLGEASDRTDTADGRPMTRRYAAARVLRMIGSDLVLSTEREAISIARQFESAMVRRLGEAIRAAVGPSVVDRWIVSGSGSALARMAVRSLPRGAIARGEVISLGDRIGDAGADAACAVALRALWEQMKPGVASCRDTASVRRGRVGARGATRGGVR